MSELAVNVDGLCVMYGSFKAVDGLSFKINRGEIYGLLGPNGAGKSSTLKVLAGILEPSYGKVEIFGKPISEEIEVKKLIGYVPEESILLESLTPREFFEFIASVRGLSGEVNPRLSKLVLAFELTEYFDTPIATLSMGTKRKVSVISALLHEPPLLILDEPLIGLDARSSRILKELIVHHARKGGAVVFSTHIMEVAEKICHRVGIIHKGKLVGEGTVSELRQLIRSAEVSLEDIFLKVTQQEAGIRDLIVALEEG
ncbi:MAG: ABC transporter ATP-binding protein [Candidatus Bathyarchaeota archaeon]|nr:ABC transporter ATP-binding protein [Candidatus Bathyarchaeota archaeon]MDW8040065.1 ABC transporter ATP-binding protein [Nitrososphaerota archaeon]